MAHFKNFDWIDDRGREQRMGAERAAADGLRQHHRRLRLHRLRQDSKLGVANSRHSHQADVHNSGSAGFYTDSVARLGYF